MNDDPKFILDEMKDTLYTMESAVEAMSEFGLAAKEAAENLKQYTEALNGHIDNLEVVIIMNAQLEG